MFKRRETCERCEEFFRLFAQVVTGVQEIEMKCNSLKELAQRNEWFFHDVRNQIKHANKEHIEVNKESLDNVISNLERLLREIEYSDDCLTSALEHIDCFNYPDDRNR